MADAVSVVNENPSPAPHSASVRTIQPSSRCGTKARPSRPAASRAAPAAPVSSGERPRARRCVRTVASGIALTMTAAPAGSTCQTSMSRTTERNSAPMSPAESSRSAALAATGVTTLGSPGSSTTARNERTGTATTAAAAIAAAGAWAMKIARQSKAWVSRPPAAGPTAAPMAAAAAHSDVARAAARRARQERQRRAQQQRAAEALHAAHGHEELEALGHPAPDRGQAEEPDAGQQRAARAQPVRERHEGEHPADEGEVVGHDDPRHVRDRGVELPDDLGQGEHDDRRVGEGEADGEAHREVAPRPARPELVLRLGLGLCDRAHARARLLAGPIRPVS